MAGSVRPSPSSHLVVRDHNWQVQYSRFFRHPLHRTPTPTSSPSVVTAGSSSSSSGGRDGEGRLISSQRVRTLGTWLSLTSEAELYVSEVGDGDGYGGGGGGGTVLSVYYGEKMMEEHLITNLHFTWPQVSCVSGFPTRGSLVVFATYRDCANEVQKFAFRFSNVDDVSGFVKFLQDSLFKKKNVSQELSPISSLSQCAPHYRPRAMQSVTDLDASEILDVDPITTHERRNPNLGVKQLGYFHNNFVTGLNDRADSSANNSMNGLALGTDFSAFPPRFTSMVTNCYQIEQGNSVALPSNTSDEADIKAQIEKYMQDASFLDMLNKVEQVINELGRGPLLQN
ncbi:POOR HOMOLOGOUS SYNAPSIS 1-like protein [Drosera capensis]